LIITSKLFILASIILISIFAFAFLPKLLQQDQTFDLPDSKAINSETPTKALKLSFDDKITGEALYTPIKNQKQSIDDIAKILEDKNPLLIKLFTDAKVPYPPQKISFLFFKQEKKLEVWALKNNHWVLLSTTPYWQLAAKLALN
jgi:hypothetical protein